MRTLRHFGVIAFLFIALFYTAVAHAQIRVKESDKPIGNLVYVGGLEYRYDIEKTGAVIRLDLGESVPADTIARIGTGRQPGAVRAFCSANPGVCQQPFHMWCGKGQNAEVCRRVQDVSISCHESANRAFCARLIPVHRERDGELNQGTPWADDAVVIDFLAGKTIDPAYVGNVTKCQYVPAVFGVSCPFKVTQAQADAGKKQQGRHESHFSGYDPVVGVIYAMFQPQRVKAGSLPIKLNVDDGLGNPAVVFGEGPAQPRTDVPSTEAISFAPATPASAPKK